ncbi:glycosyl hydrolase family 28 protein [Streptomyces sp. NPDC020192]|uniref:glycosyl hydrolase family 28 protein n=1 Tax=Streptomyces sp. NPDC020192 TaxID=3365066 RepID=UPI0037ADBDBF
MTGTDSFGNTSSSSNGLRIKSSPAHGGKVSQVTYTDTCLTKVRYPLVFDTHYAGGTGSYTPYFTGITVNGLKSTSPSPAPSPPSSDSTRAIRWA